MDNSRRTIIIDDDPTGCQTVRGIPLVLNWDPDLLSSVLKDSQAVFILTNTRAMDAERALEMSRSVCRSIREVSRRCGYTFSVISRSDSMLRGHLAEELSPLLEAFPDTCGIVLAPVFFECGRITENDTHYLISDGRRIPASQTEFASDPVFGYGSSCLPEWLEERSEGLFHSSECISIDRNNAAEAIESSSGKRSVFIVNAASYDDLYIICKQFKAAEQRGLRFVYRSAASLVKAYLEQYGDNSYHPAGGLAHVLVVAGSYTALTTSQIECLTAPGDIYVVRLDVDRLNEGEKYLRGLASEADKALRKGHCLICTSREFKPRPSKKEQISLGEKISDALCRVCAGITAAPQAIITKGGITSHAIARNALGIKSAMVMGQVDAGVSVWRTTKTDFDFVVFPGNVGQKDSLRSVFERFIY